MTAQPRSLVIINSVEIQPIVVREHRVLTLAQIDKVHGRPEGTAKRNFTENKSRLLEGQDWFSVSPDEIRTTSPGAISSAHRSNLTVVTESGYLLLVKSFTDDLAWQVQRELVNAYFRVNPERVVGAATADTLIPSEAQTLKELVHRKLAALPSEIHGKALAEIWSRVQRKFRVNSYTYLPRTQLTDAIAYIMQMDLHCAPAAPKSTAGEPLSVDQHREIKRLIDNIARWNHHDQSWKNGIWFALRQVTGASAPERFQIEQLPAIASELLRAYAISETLNRAIHEAEQIALKRLVRQREEAGPLLEELRTHLLTVAASDHAEFASQLERWQLLGLMRLLQTPGPALSDWQPDQPFTLN